MNTTIVQALIKRAQSIKKSEQLNYEKLSQMLGVHFSEEFKRINDLVGFDYFGGFEWYNSDQVGKYNMIDETLFFREQMKLPQDIVVVANQGESILLMKCYGDHEEVYWIDNVDFERFCNGEPLEAWNKVFLTFPDFFKFLLDEEEKMRAEEK